MNDERKRFKGTLFCKKGRLKPAPASVSRGCWGRLQPAPSPGNLREHRPAVLHALLRFLDRIGPFRNGVLELDRRRERPLVLLHEEQDVLDLAVAGAERDGLRAVD